MPVSANFTTGTTFFTALSLVLVSQLPTCTQKPARWHRFLGYKRRSGIEVPADYFGRLPVSHPRSRSSLAAQDFKTSRSAELSPWTLTRLLLLGRSSVLLESKLTQAPHYRRPGSQLPAFSAMQDKGLKLHSVLAPCEHVEARKAISKTFLQAKIKSIMGMFHFQNQSSKFIVIP